MEIGDAGLGHQPRRFPGEPFPALAKTRLGVEVCVLAAGTHGVLHRRQGGHPPPAGKPTQPR
jgi:hypothetical protein